MRRLIAAAVFLFSLHIHAGVTVVQNVSPGATSWPGTPIISTMANPSSATVPICFTNGMTTTFTTNGMGIVTTNVASGTPSLGQTFTITTTNYLLQQIDIYAGGGTGTGVGTNLVLRLYDLGFQTAPEPTPYGGVVPNETIAGDLFGSGSGLSVTCTNQANGILEFDFAGVDQAVLQVGHMYTFELDGTVRTRPLNWFSRTSGNPYSGGAAYTNKYWLNASSACDFSMAIYGTATAPIAAPAPQSALCTVNWTNVKQRIDGFGASSAWRNSWTTAQADMLFSTNTGIGLSLLRSRIAPGGTTVENSIMQMAQARGARVWSAPWSPAVQFKSNGNVNGGSFVGTTGNYQAYAGQLAGYVKNMVTTYGINLYALSVQNEPDANVTSYESCNWTAQQIHDFVPYLYSALAASNVAATKIMLPESQNWPDYQGLATTTMNDPVVATNVGIIADHNYDGATGPGSLAKNSYGKALWETEVSLLSGSGSSIYNGVYWAGRIHAYMTVAQANAWHHWWLISGNTTANQGLFDSAGNPAKRMYVMGNFSRFVRPNFNRIGVVTNSGNAVVSAYKDPISGRFAIVAINTNPTNSINLTLNLTNFTAGSVIPWVTSRSLSLASQSAVVVSNSSFTYTLPGPSVVSFVGQGDVAPTNISLSNASASENQPPGAPVGNFSTADPDAGNTFAYTLASGAGGADNASFTITNNTLYTAAIFDVAVQSTFNIRVRSTDQNGLWIEKPFSISVTPDSQARTILNVVAAPDGNWTLTFAGIPGYSYRVQAATDLAPPAVWMTLTNNFDGGILFTADTSGLWMHVDLNSTNYPNRYYRTVEP